MPAFSDTQLQNLLEGLKSLHSRVQSTNQLSLTRDEFYNLFVDADVRYILENAPKVGADRSMVSTCTCQWDLLVPAELTLNLLQRPDERYSPLAPKYPGRKDSAPSHLVTRVSDWVVRRVEIGTDFARAGIVLRLLDGQCTTTSQVRYAWPSVVALAKMNEATQKLAEQLAPFRQPRTIPPLNHEFRQALRKASATVAGALLLEEDIPAVPTEVTILGINGLVQVEEPGLPAFVPW